MASPPSRGATFGALALAAVSLAVVSFAVVSIAGCAPGSPAPPMAPGDTDGSAPAASAVQRLLPLRDGFVLSYRVRVPEGAEPQQLILQVERRSTEHATLRSGNLIKRLELAPDGVRLLTGGYLLKEPLALGAEWAGPAGRVRVSALDRGVDVPAGHFAGCIETTEQSRPPSARAIVTLYCPDVGIVSIHVQDREREELVELVSFGPRVDIDAL